MPGVGGGVVWMSCAGCGCLFPATSGRTFCCLCGAGPAGGGRCAAAHPQDRSGCEGPGDAVRVVDRAGDEVAGCVRHAAVVLASVEGAGVYPGSVAGAAVVVFERARSLRPFQFDQPGAGVVAGGGR